MIFEKDYLDEFFDFLLYNIKTTASWLLKVHNSTDIFKKCPCQTCPVNIEYDLKLGYVLYECK